MPKRADLLPERAIFTAIDAHFRAACHIRATRNWLIAAPHWWTVLSTGAGDAARGLRNSTGWRRLVVVQIRRCLEAEPRGDVVT